MWDEGLKKHCRRLGAEYGRDRDGDGDIPYEAHGEMYKYHFYVSSLHAFVGGDRHCFPNPSFDTLPPNLTW